ncbi:hypothetical protein AAFC00_000045 [Neodothiora populina]|uniref:RING-type domain-containing protein n=1 Tax=Neodothiora populina TaxID=2781224 RepID=A0ABR3P1J8_9PEZI
MSENEGHYDANNSSLNFSRFQADTSGNRWDTNAEWNWPSDLHAESRDAPSSPHRSLPPPQAAVQVQTQTQAQSQARPRLRPTAAPSVAAEAPRSTPPSFSPHYYRQLPPLSHANPIASLTAALRGDTSGLGNPPTQGLTSSSSSSVAQSGSLAGRSTDNLRRLPTPPPPPPRNNEQPVRGVLLRAEEPRSATDSPSPSPSISLSPTSSPFTMPRTSATLTRKRSRGAASDGTPDAKRRRNSGIQEVDLSTNKADSSSAKEAILEKEREQLVKRQREESGKAVRLNDLQCMICLERFTNMSVTHCGHLFCHECLIQALNASERASERNVGTCPACRKPIKRGPSAKNQIIPLAMMKKPVRSSVHLT